MNQSFKNILENHTVEDLDIESKDISINLQNIDCFQTELKYRKFQTSILNQQKIKIGYFGLIISKKGEIVDEYFVID